MDMILYVVQFESELCPRWPCIRNQVKLLFKQFVCDILFQAQKLTNAGRQYITIGFNCTHTRGWKCEGWRTVLGTEESDEIIT